MSSGNPIVAQGYSDVPPGHAVSVVTCLEMHAKAAVTQARLPDNFVLDRLGQYQLPAYRRLFAKVGADWFWQSRAVMSDAQLGAILANDDVRAFALRSEGVDMGMLELDFREPGQCELAFFGLAADAIGNGMGRALMNHAIELAWSHPISRLWVHTCTHDHPAALAFYIRSGFTPYAFQVEMQPDPRLTGHLPRDAARHIPIVGSLPSAGQS